MVLDQVFSAESVILNLQSKDKNSLFAEMLDSLKSANPDVDKEEALSAICEREAKMSTGIMHDIAVPHGSCNSVKKTVGVIGISREGIDYNSLDGDPVHFIFMLLSGTGETEGHLSALKELASILQNPAFIKELKTQDSKEAVYNLICKYESSASA